MKYILAIICLGISLSSPAYAASKNTVSGADRKHVATALEKISKVAGKTLTATDIQATPIQGLLQVTADMSIFYVSTDGKYIISGDLIDINKDKKNWSLTEAAMRIVRKQALSQLNPNDMIVFPANGKKIGVVTVFTDVDCTYCRKLQDHIEDYTDLGIEVRYLAFPRTGPNTPSFKKSVSVWCAKDKQKAYALAVEGKDVEDNQCANNPVMSDFELGRKLSVSGTPTMFLENGMHLPGMVDAKDLAKLIKDEDLK